jgi:hypothetical protein
MSTVEPGPQAIMLHGSSPDTQETTLILAMETPILVAHGDKPIAKGAIERMHLERYRSDYLNSTGRLPFENVRSGPDPSTAPDFTVETFSGTEVIDCTSFMVEERRHAYHLFMRVSQQIATEAAAGKLPHLEDSVIRIWFGQGASLPPKKSDDRTLSALMKTIRDCTIHREHLASIAREIADRGFPQQLRPDDMAIFWTPNQSAGFNVSPVDHTDQPQREGRPPGNITCVLSMSSTVTSSQIQAELTRLVTENHDNPKTDHLLITFGGPDLNGLKYPADEMLARFVTDEMLSALSVRWLKRLSLHCWTLGTIVERILAPTGGRRTS